MNNFLTKLCKFQNISYLTLKSLSFYMDVYDDLRAGFFLRSEQIIPGKMQVLVLNALEIAG